MVANSAGTKVMEQNDLLPQIMKFWEVTVLVKNKAVCRNWSKLCTQIIDAKCDDKKLKFQQNMELRANVKQYLRFHPDDAEKFASTYGWPMGKWDVSSIRDFSFMFYCHSDFNEDISNWDTSNATNMVCMFYLADSFNRDISKWNTSKVKIMAHMFVGAKCFNQNISKWDFSSLELQSEMKNIFSVGCLSIRREYRPVKKRRKLIR